MKKSILYSCALALVLGTNVAWAEPETTDSIKTAFTKFLTTQTQLSNVLNFNDISVNAEGKDFVITIPAVENEQMKIPSRTIHLTEDGTFNEHPQYRFNSVFETIQSLFQDMLPGSTFTSTSADMNIIWVPYYNLVSKSSQNIQGLNIQIPGMFKATIDSIIADTLARPTSADKMDKADSQDAKGVVISSDDMKVSIPTVSYSDQIVGASITGDATAQVLSSEETTYRLTMPTIVVSSATNASPLGSFSVVHQGNFKNENIHMDFQVSNIVLDKALQMLLPASLTPTNMTARIDFKGASQADLEKLFTATQNGNSNPEELEPIMQNILATTVIYFDPIEIKNADSGIKVTGTVRNKPTSDGQPSPLANAQIVITNLDKISPEPRVDAEQCEKTKQQMADITDKEISEKAIANACTPRGGVLDDLRQYLNPENRVVNADGTTTDTLSLTLEDDVLKLNGKEVQ